MNLSDVRFFSDINTCSIEKIKQFSIIKHYKKGEDIFMYKDKLDYLYVVLSGKVSMQRVNTEGQKRLFYILDEGNLINENVFDEYPSSVDCVAFENCEIILIDKVELLSVMENDFKLTMKILNSIGKKQRRLYRQLKNTLPIGIDKKLAAKLWKLSKDYGVIWNDGIKLINLRVSCTNLAYMLGTTRESVSRAMRLLIEVGVCFWKEKELYVNEQECLKYYRGE
ncbi:MAG: Crp/Fnr family transcriptional regulator [Anaerorhabdus sp.]